MPSLALGLMRLLMSYISILDIDDTSASLVVLTTTDSLVVLRYYYFDCLLLLLRAHNDCERICY